MMVPRHGLHQHGLHHHHHHGVVGVGPSGAHLQQHQQQQVLQHRCESCGRQYQWRESLTRHQRVECGKEAALQCPVCPTRTKHKHSLQRHIQLHFAAGTVTTTATPTATTPTGHDHDHGLGPA